MKLRNLLTAVLALTLAMAGSAAAKQQIYPVGTVRYDPEKTWNSYVILSGVGQTAKLIDRNGNLVHEWDMRGGDGQPNKVYAGGYLLTSLYQGLTASERGTVALLDFDGNIVRQFSRYMQVEAPLRNEPASSDGNYWLSRQHHDYQLEGDPVGYYSPETRAQLDGKMLVLVHDNKTNPQINEGQLMDDVIIIVDQNENILWSWSAVEHFEQFGLLNHPEAMDILHSKGDASNRSGGAGYDWFHINCASWLGPNQWYDAGDARFHPDNIIADSRETGHVFIIDHASGDVVWQIAPPFSGEDAAIGPVIGVHHSHMIPKGLPGAGNVMIFNNGGMSTYFPKIFNYYSRVTKFNPSTREVVWEYSALTPMRPGLPWFRHADQIFFSPFISSAQRLPNGNTLIDEGAAGRLFEVTADKEIVWEYYSPYHYMDALVGNNLYRAYAVPYEFVPQLSKPVEEAVAPPRREQIVMPTVNGNLPNYIPTMDQRRQFQFGEPAPVLIPGVTIQ